MRGREQRLVAVLASTMLMIGCGSAPAAAPAPAAPRAAETAVDIEARRGLIRRFYIDGFIGGNLAVIDSVLAPSYVRHDTGRTSTAGRDLQYQLVRNLRQSFPDLQATVDFVLVEGDTVAARWTMWGTNTVGGQWGPPNNQPFRFSGLNIFRFENGQVVEIWNHRDDLSFMQQLGVVTMPDRN